MDYMEPRYSLTLLGNGRSGYDHTTANSITILTTASQINATDNCQIIHHTNNNLRNSNPNGNENATHSEQDEFV